MKGRPALVASLGSGALALLLLATAAQPLITDDAWLHLALGEAYATEGPWLDADPLLARAPGPPTPAAWLFDVALYEVARLFGFGGLRGLHAALVAGILALAWSLLRRAAGGAVAAHLLSGLFLTLAAYRLIQLRPHLLSMLAALVLYRLLLERGAPPSRTRIALAALLCAVWANLHAAFLLGPLLIGAALAGLLLALPFGGPATRERLRARALALAAAGALALLASLVNPAGSEPHQAWFVAGSDTPTLGRVADEWTPVRPFALPLPGLPPSPLCWAIFWTLGVGSLAAAAFAPARWRRSQDAGNEAPAIDPALIGLAGLGLALPLIAVRFLWLGVFPLLLLAAAARLWLAPRPAAARAAAWLGAAATLALLPAFLRLGPWPMLRGALPSSLAEYRLPYRAGKYHADLIWMLKDAGLEGTAFSDYHMAGFAGFFLTPKIRTLVNGTLNVPPDVIAANLPLRLRRGERPGERYTELLDRHGVDLFVGIRPPRVAEGARPWFHTTGHLERTPGWIPVFRNLTGAVYLRNNERNRANLARVREYYEREGLDFDAERGFDVEQVVRSDRSWATSHGVIPLHFDAIASAAFGADPRQRDRAREALAQIYAVLGLYERAVELDRRQLEADPARETTRRRLVWCLLRLRQLDEARALAPALEQSPDADPLSRWIAAAAREAALSDDEEARAELIARLPLLSAAEAATLTSNVMVPAARVYSLPMRRPPAEGESGRAARSRASRS